MYHVPAGGVFRPVVEPAVERYSAEENNECFDRVVRRLEQTARRAVHNPTEWADLAAIWSGVVGEDGEISKGLMDGGPDGRGYSRGQIWSKFAHVPGGPRCLLRIAIWQNGKLRLGAVMTRYFVVTMSAHRWRRRLLVLPPNFQRLWLRSFGNTVRMCAAWAPMTWIRHIAECCVLRAVVYGGGAVGY